MSPSASAYLESWVKLFEELKRHNLRLPESITVDEDSWMLIYEALREKRVALGGRIAPYTIEFLGVCFVTRT